MIAHVVQWLIMGTTITPIEPSETMYTLNEGLLNAGFLFFTLAILATLILGRFVCGWGCHLVAYQDLCAWLLKKIGVKPKPFRSRILVLAPLALALYMFVWPTIYRWAAGVPAPQLTNHLTTSEFWKTFPGPVVAILTIAVCGFGIVYFLGAKGFCTYACPYGGFFGLADKFAVGRIRVTDACEHCGHCTAVCSSNVKVHEEVALYGMVVDPGCMKCMDCVSVCPNDALYFGFGKPSMTAQPSAPRRPTPYDFSMREEIVLVVVGLVCLLAYRGLYERIPLLLAMAMAAITAYLLMKGVYLLRDANVRLQSWQLKRGRRLTRAGTVYSVGVVLWLVFSMHSALVQFHTWRGRWLLASLNPGDEIWLPGDAWREQATEDQTRKAAVALSALTRADQWGLMTSPRLLIERTRVHLALGDTNAAETTVRRLIDADPGHAEAHRGLGNILRKERRLDEAEAAYREALRLNPELSTVRLELATLLTEGDRLIDARALFDAQGKVSDHLEFGRWLLAKQRAQDARLLLSKSVERYPEAGQVYALLGAACLASGDAEAGTFLLRRALELDPNLPDAHYQLGMARLRQGRIAEAVTALTEAVRLAPGVALYHYNLSVAMFMSGRPADALPCIREAIRLEPSDADAHGFHAVILRELGDFEEAKSAEAEADRWKSRR